MTDFEIDAFFAIAETHSITAAADKLGITQSALSRRIMSLEGSLGYDLLVHKKGSHNVQLTDLGNRFYFIAQKWKLIWEEAQALPNARGQSVISISTPDSISSYLMPEVYERFSGRFPNVRLVCNTSLSFDAVSAVEAGHIDICIIARPPKFSPLIDVHQLYSESLVCVVGKNSRYKSGIQPSDLDPMKEVRIIVTDDFCAWHDYWYANGHNPLYFLDKFSYTFNSNFPLFDNNWAFVPATIANNLIQEDKVRIIDVKNAPPARIVYYVTQNKSQSQELIEFINVLQETVKAIPYITPFF